MKRKRFQLAVCILLFLLLPATLCFFAFGLPAQYAGTFLGGFADKAALLRGTGGKRILLTGGSGAAFAVRSDLLEAELPGYSVVNLGMYAGLGSTVPLDAAKGELRPGDIVIFLPEQNEQTLSMYFGSEAMWQAADGHWDLLQTVRQENLRALLGQFPYFAAQKAAFFLRGVPAAGDGIYTRDAFNRYGDIESPLRASNIMPGGYDKNTPIAFDEALPASDFLAYVNEYAKDAARVGASFYFAFCPMNAAATDDSQAEAYMQRLSDSLACPLLGRVQDSIMEAGWFYDTNFHLNSAGAVVYTACLASALKNALGITTDTLIPLPDMPTSAPTAFFQGDDRDEACFSYEQQGDGWYIVGLTAQGKQRTALILPTAHLGVPVTGFDASVFAGNSVLQSLTIQGNIRQIADASFDGCTALSAIVMQLNTPANCAIGTALLAGTSANIYVEESLLFAYRTNYFWAMYANRTLSLAPQPTTAAQTAAPATEGDFIHYDGNGGFLLASPGESRLDAPLSQTHLRTNTLQGTNVFARPGYVQLGWNTQPDGTGLAVGLGSRASAAPGMTFYAQWAQESPAADFTYTADGSAVSITGYHGTRQTCVLPMQIGGLPVQTVCTGAFQNVSFDVLVLSPSIQVVEPSAFISCSMDTLYLYDNLQTLSGDSFADCASFTTLHLNAATAPVYSTSYYASFADKYDWLLSLAGQKKLVLFSGSSTRYGYNSETLLRAYPAYQPANMGVYAYTNALPQMELLLLAMEEGDVLLHAPEFDCLNFQTCENNKLDFHFMAMMEANYDCISLLDMGAYSQVFESLQQYFANRAGLPARTYEETPNGYDDDGNNMRTPTYNKYGDFIMPRANTKIDIMLKYVRAEYTPAPFTPQCLDALNREYRRFLDRGIQVLFTYTSRNRSSITEDSTPENRKALDRLLRSTLCVPVISKIEDSLISGEYFFVIDSHLSTEGTRLHTQQIVKDLKPWLTQDMK